MLIWFSFWGALFYNTLSLVGRKFPEFARANLIENHFLAFLAAFFEDFIANNLSQIVIIWLFRPIKSEKNSFHTSQ